MVPAKEVAAHSWFCPTALVTRILMFIVSGSGIELPRGPHGPRLATVCPVYAAPVRDSFMLKEKWRPLTWAITSHAPVAHAGLNCQVIYPFRPPCVGTMFLP